MMAHKTRLPILTDVPERPPHLRDDGDGEWMTEGFSAPRAGAARQFSMSEFQGKNDKTRFGH
jgi:hypothetical protein